MLRAVFVGTKNEFNENLIHWLSQRVDLKGVVYPLSTNWRKSFRGKLGFLKKLIKRYGILKAVDEMIFFLIYRKYHSKNDYKALQEEIIFPYRRHNYSKWDGKSISTHNINSDLTINFVKECNPEIIFAMCVNDYFKKEILEIPEFGVYLWHEGITPEYRGLYSPFWAVKNLDFTNIGYTLLKMNKKIDGGEIFLQGKFEDFDISKHHHAYIGHKAIWSSLDAVDQFIIDLENGIAKPIQRSMEKQGYYTYPGFTDYIQQRRNVNKFLRSTLIERK